MAKLIMVCGAGRSGTTMLDLMLGNGERSFSCGEVHAWFRPWRAHHYKLSKCACQKDDCNIWQRLGAVQEHQFHRTVFSELNFDTVVDSSKSLSWIVDSHKWAMSQKYDVANVLIWKDPIELAYSHWKRDSDKSKWYKNFVGYHSRLHQIGLDYVSVEHRELVSRPAKVLSRLCDILNVEYFPGKEAFWNGNHHHLFGSAGTAAQIGDPNASFEASCTFSNSFRAEHERVRQVVENDNEILQVLDRLKSKDYSRIVTDRKPVLERRVERLPRAYPLWYLRQTGRDKVRRLRGAMLRKMK